MMMMCNGDDDYDDDENGDVDKNRDGDYGNDD